MVALGSMLLSLVFWIFWGDVSLPLWLLPLILLPIAWGFGEADITGTYHLESAALAETWTAKELRGLRGEGAESIDYLPFDRMDIDHVLVHPAGVFAIDTKYTDREADLGTGEPDYLIAGWRASAAASARKIDLFLNRTEHRFHVKVTPLVVVWGSALEGDANDTGEVRVIRGAKLLETLRTSMGLPNIDLGKQQRIFDALKDFNDKRDAHELRRDRTGKGS